MAQRFSLGAFDMMIMLALMRLGGMPKDPALVLKVLREGQRLNGGYGKEDNEMASDLESTYRVMRCFMMLLR